MHLHHCTGEIKKYWLGKTIIHSDHRFAYEDVQKIIEEKNLVAYSFYNKTKKFLNIDVIIDIPKSFSELWENRIVKTTDDYQINLIGFDDLILLKEYANRVQDKNDILLLKSANKK